MSSEGDRMTVVSFPVWLITPSRFKQNLLRHTGQLSDSANVLGGKQVFKNENQWDWYYTRTLPEAKCRATICNKFQSGT